MWCVIGPHFKRAFVWMPIVEGRYDRTGIECVLGGMAGGGAR